VSNGEERFFRDDRVLFTKPNRKYSGIENGHRGTIVRIDPIRGEATVRLDHEPKLLHPKATPAEIVTIPVRKFGAAIALGYAVTTNKGQSQTVKHALLLMGGDLLDQHLAYTQVSRARESTRIFIDKSHAGEQWKDLIAAVERSRPKTTAYEHTDRATRKQIGKRLANQGPALERER
jgi:ATP-dependent exoDNAse (exonuclease V) alpha subunit